MATITWKNPISDVFSNAADWTGGVVPGAGDAAVLGALSGAAYTVTVNSGETVNSIQTAANATLSVSGGTFIATAGTGTGVNAGAISVGNNNTFEAGGTLDNTGTIALNGMNGYTTALYLTGNTTLSGGGHLTLSDSVSNYVYGAAASDTLTNANNIISGAGQLGNGQMTLVNQAAGIIDATGGNALVINTGANVVTNAGLLEATGAGGLNINSTTINNSTGGTITANGGNVNLATADIIGGTLTTMGGGVIDTADNGSVLDGTSSTVNNQGVVSVSNNTQLTLKGAINNTGTISLAGVNGYDTQLNIGANTTLTGGGHVTLSDITTNYVFGVAASDTLTNTDNTISGGGQLGYGQLTLVNQAAGIIDATGGNALVLNTGANAVANSGLLEATGAGGLNIRSTTISNTVTGIISAAGSHVDLTSADIQGGTLTTSNGGMIDTTDTGSLLDGLGSHKVYVLGNAVISNNTALTVQGNIELTQKVGKITTNGTLTLNGVNGYNTQLIASAKNATITGSQIILSDSNSNYIEGTQTKVGKTYKDSSLNNKSDIVGAGDIGANLVLTNSLTIDATGGNALIIQTGSSNVAKSNIVKNSGLIESTNPNSLSSVGGLLIRSTTITNSSKGVIEANGAATHVDLQTATIIGGTLKTLAGGIIQTIDGGSVLNATTTAIANEAAIVINNNTALTIEGAFNNTATVTLNGVNGYNTDLIVGANTTLTGAGHVTLSDSAANYIYGALATDTLTNTNNTISGAGQLGSGQLTLVNQASGVIDATGVNNQLVINTGVNAVTNSGLIEATGSGGLRIVSTTIDGSTGGVISAIGTHIDLQSATIVGGTLEGSSGGYFDAVDGGSVLNGTSSTVNNQTTVTVNLNRALTIEGAINNTGAITMAGQNGYNTDLIMGANTTLTGSGQISLSDSSANYIYGAAAADTLTNTNNTISGAGQLGDGQLTLVNQASGVIDATGTNNQLTINTGANAVTNTGLIEATGSAGLRITSTTVNGSTGGVISAVGSHVDLQSANIAGGTIKSSGGGYFDTADNSSVLNGVASILTDQAAVTVNNNSNLTIEGAIANTGTLTVNGLNGYSTNLILGANTTLTGSGHVTLSDSSANYIYGAIAADTLTNGNTISGAGQLGDGQMTLANQAAGVIDATGSGNALVINTGTNTITNAGLIEATGSAGLTIDSAITNTGTIAASGANVTIVANVGGTGSETITGAAKLEISSSYGAGAAQTVTFQSGSTGTFKVDNAQDFTGTVVGLATGNTLDLANIAYATASLTYSGNTSSGVLTVKDGTNTAVFKLTGNYTQGNFHLANDGSNDTDVTYSGTGRVVSSLNSLVQAMASFGAGHSASTSLSHSSFVSAETAMLAHPHHA